MASETNDSSYSLIGDPMPPSSATPPPRRGWWSRPIITIPRDREPTLMEIIALLTPMYLGAITLIIVYFINQAPYQAKFNIQSIAVSPSTATWHVDFLVTNPNSRYSIYYGGDTAVRLGSLNAAVLNTSHKSNCPNQTVFSVDFVVEDNNDVVYEQLDIKLRANHKTDLGDIAGHIDIRCHNLIRIHENVDIRCHNLTLIHENVEKIQCHSSFTKLKTLRKVQRNCQTY